MVAQQLVPRGIQDPAVLAALGRIPRELFMAPERQGAAYDDAAHPIACEQTISQPYIVARMTELLELTPAARVLEVGTGSGYQTAVLATLCAHVYSIEWFGRLFTQAAERLATLDLQNVTLRCGDGSLGWPEYAPYDGILVTAGAPEVPAPLAAQLAPGGRLVIPTGPLGDQTLVVMRRVATGLERHDALPCRFVPLWGAGGWRT